MRICIPTVDDEGPRSRLFTHFGRHALAGLRRRGVAVFVAAADTGQEAVEALSAGRVVAAELDESGHGGGTS